jgi:CubicO group peptidase (beta-lactamase class C family)
MVTWVTATPYEPEYRMRDMTDTRALLVEAARRHSLGGVAVAVVRKGEPPAFECLGLADRDTNRVVDTDTVFRIASVSKTMTAVGLMQLRDQGLFELDDPVNKFLTSFSIEPPPGGADVTFRHLLTHTAGIGELPRVSDLARRSAWGIEKPGTAGADLGDMYRGTLRPDSAAGAKWAYANHGFAVLGQVIEDITGQPFAEHMQQHLFQPLAMEHTEYTRTDRTKDKVATGYHWVFGRFNALKDYDLAVLGPGSVLSSLADMSTYAEWLLHAGAGANGDVLRPETLAEMMSPQYSVDPRITGMGLAFWLDHMGDHRVGGHDGNLPGFASSLIVAPDDGVGVVALTNNSSFIGAHLLAHGVLRSLLGVPDPASELARTDVAPSPHLWPELAGHYAPAPGFLTNIRSWQMVGGEVQVLVKNRRLVIRGLSMIPVLRRGLELHPVDPDDPLLFAVEAEGLVVPIAFSRREPGCIDSVAVGPPANTTFYRRSTLRSTRVRGGLVLGGALAAAVFRRRRRLKRPPA